MVRALKKEICEHCKKHINKGQSITECMKCNIVIHTKCLKISNFELINEKWYCENCSETIAYIYNPFRNLSGPSHGKEEETEYSDKHYDYNIEEVFNDLADASNILEYCKSLKSAGEFNRFCELKGVNNSNFSTLFQNVDGNRSNFDNFAAHISRIEHKFSVIGLAETNICPKNKNLYDLDEYKSYYQDKYPNKSKGTGVALYIHNALSATVEESLSQCSDNLESLFVSIQIGTELHTIGVVYQPPSGDKTNFLLELELLVKKCNPKNLHIFGDFNMNLHNPNCKTVEKFEEIILSNGLFPLISISTHAKPGCQQSCIDNIFTSNISSVMASGTLELGISHHHSIFQVMEINHNKEEKLANIQYYDFSKSKTDIFLEDITKTFENCSENLSLEQFLSMYDSKIDCVFKLDSPKKSKRNRKCNPWITDCIIISIDKKDKLYADWVRTRTKKNPHGDQNLYQKYRDYRRTLKHTITAAKKKHYGKQFKNYEGNMKKTWEIINELRGKRKPTAKSYFIIDN